MKFTFEGTISAQSRAWTKVLLLHDGDTLEIAFSGRWIVNSGWANPKVEYLGDPQKIAPSGFRGQGYPEGCMLLRQNGERPFYSPDPIWKFSFNKETEIFLAPNDGLGPKDHRDNRGHIAFKLRATMGLASLKY